MTTPDRGDAEPGKPGFAYGHRYCPILLHSFVKEFQYSFRAQDGAPFEAGVEGVGPVRSAAGAGAFDGVPDGEVNAWTGSSLF